MPRIASLRCQRLRARRRDAPTSSRRASGVPSRSRERSGGPSRRCAAPGRRGVARASGSAKRCPGCPPSDSARRGRAPPDRHPGIDCLTPAQLRRILGRPLPDRRTALAWEFQVALSTTGRRKRPAAAPSAGPVVPSEPPGARRTIPPRFIRIGFDRRRARPCHSVRTVSTLTEVVRHLTSRRIPGAACVGGAILATLVTTEVPGDRADRSWRRRGLPRVGECRRGHGSGDGRGALLASRRGLFLGEGDGRPRGTQAVAGDCQTARWSFHLR